MIGFNIKETYTYEILVKNNGDSVDNIKVMDQIPIAADKSIEVSALELSGGKVDDVTGEVSWDVKVKPDETKKLIFKFSYKYPKNKKKDLIFNVTQQYKSPRYF